MLRLLLLFVIAALPGRVVLGQTPAEVVRHNLDLILGTGGLVAPPYTFVGRQFTPPEDPSLAKVKLLEVETELYGDLASLLHPQLGRADMPFADGTRPEALLESLLKSVNASTYGGTVGPVLLKGVWRVLEDWSESGEQQLVLGCECTPRAPAPWLEAFRLWQGADHGQDFDASALLLEFGETEEVREKARSWLIEIMDQRFGEALAAPLRGTYATDLRGWSSSPGGGSGIARLLLRQGHPEALVEVAGLFRAQGLEALAAFYEGAVRAPVFPVSDQVRSRQPSEVALLAERSIALDPRLVDLAALGGSVQLSVPPGDGQAPAARGNLRADLELFLARPGPQDGLLLSRQLLAEGYPCLAFGLGSAAVQSSEGLGASDLIYLTILAEAAGAPLMTETQAQALLQRLTPGLGLSAADLSTLFGG